MSWRSYFFQAYFAEISSNAIGRQVPDSEFHADCELLQRQPAYEFHHDLSPSLLAREN
jgi:hypothetical protein